jgi:pilus assembly protein CpaB
MNKNVLIVLAGGFVIAILVAVLVQASLGGKKVDDTGPKTQVLVAAKTLALGKEIEPGDLKWQTWPGEAFDGAIVRRDDQKAEDALKGRLIEKVNQGQPVLPSYIFREGKGNVVAATLQPGMRAVAIPVKAFTMAGGFVTPGDHVDVILTYRLAVDREDRANTSSFVRNLVSETILKNIRVLAVDQDATQEKEDAKIAKTVTLAVRAEDAERLALASDMGDIILALRGIGDTADSHPAAMTTDIEVSKAMQNVFLMSGAESTGSVRIYNGPVMTETQTRGARPQSFDEDFENSSAEVDDLVEAAEGMADTMQGVADTVENVTGAIENIIPQGGSQ